jgi:hypothetical protein
VKGLVAFLAVLVHSGVSAQTSVVGALQSKDGWWGNLQVTLVTSIECVWTFNVYDHARFMGLLRRIHAKSQYEYEVEWGKPDRLKIKGEIKREKNSGELLFFTTLGTAAEAVDLRVGGEVGSSYSWDEYESVVLWPPDPEYFGTGTGDGKAVPRPRSSFDVLAEALYASRRGYRVQNVAGVLADAMPKGKRLSELVEWAAALDKGIEIVEGERFLLRRRLGGSSGHRAVRW